jgi:hypothetical protein
MKVTRASFNQLSTQTSQRIWGGAARIGFYPKTLSRPLGTLSRSRGRGACRPTMIISTAKPFAAEDYFFLACALAATFNRKPFSRMKPVASSWL